MKRYWFPLLIIVSIFLFGFDDFSQLQASCAPTIESRLSIGQQARVTIDEQFLRIREDAGIESEPLVDLSTGDVINVIDGAICMEDMYWWQVVTESGVHGWSVEYNSETYFVEPLNTQNTNLFPETPEREVQRIDYEQQAVWNTDETGLLIFDISDCQPIIRDAVTDEVVIDFTMSICLQSHGIWSPDNTRIFTITDETGMIWDIQAGAMIREFPLGNGGQSALSYLWSADSQSIVGIETDISESMTTQLFIWDVNTQSDPTISEVTIPLESLLPYQETLSPDGRLFLASPPSMQPIYVWDIVTDAEVAMLNSDVNMFFAVSWLGNGSRLATTSLDILSIWDTDTWSQNLQLTGHSSTIRALAWSPDGQYIASGDENGRIKIWDAESGQLLITLMGHTRNIYNLEWNNTGTYLLSYAWDGTNRVWDVQLP